MNRQKSISANILEGIARILGDTNRGLTGSEIGHILKTVKLTDIDPSSTKWKRIYNAFVEFQNKNQTSNNILNFVKLSMDPARYINSRDWFDEQRDKLNRQMSFAGFQLSEAGRLQKIEAAATLSEAMERAAKLKSKLQDRNGHQEVFKFCKAELISNNYFHAVFE